MTDNASQGQCPWNFLINSQSFQKRKLFFQCSASDSVGLIFTSESQSLEDFYDRLFVCVVFFVFFVCLFVCLFLLIATMLIQCLDSGCLFSRLSVFIVFLIERFSFEGRKVIVLRLLR